MAHGCTWTAHWLGPFGQHGDVEPFKFVGWFGPRTCPGGWGWICGLLDMYQGTKSPLEPAAPHEWRRFTVNVDGWGNDDSHVAFVEGRPDGEYLGQFVYSHGARHTGDHIRFRAKAYDELRTASAIISGTARFTNEDQNRQIHLGLPVDGYYTFDEDEVSSEGQASISIVEDLYPHGGAARDCLADIVYDNNSGVANGTRATARVTLAVVQNPSARAVKLRISGLGGGGGRLDILDVGGRVVERIGLEGDRPRVIESRRLHPGVYFARLRAGETSWRSGPLVVVD